MGLLDMIGIDGPEEAQGPALTRGLLALGSNRKRPFTGLLQALAVMEAQMQAAKDKERAIAKDKLSQELLQEQIGETRAQAAQRMAAAEQVRLAAQQEQKDNLLMRGIGQPQAGPVRPGETMPTMSFDPGAFMAQGGSRGALKDLIDLQSKLQPKPDVRSGKEPIVERQPDGTYKQVWSGEPEEKKLPSDVQAYEYARQQGYKGTFLDFQLAQRRAGATSITLGSPVPVQMPDGSTALVQPANRPGEPPQIMSMPGTGQPLRPQDKPLTESESKNRAYHGQMSSAEKELSKIPINLTQLPEQVGVALAGGLTNPLASSPAQQARQSQEQWAEAFLRFKTGAAAPKDEVIRNIATYFPRVGDGPDVVEQKARMRQQAMKDVLAAAGQRGNVKPSEKTVVRRGTRDGKRVVQYSDGSIEEE